MKRAIVSPAERIAALKMIPSQKIPSTLKTEVKLPNINQIQLVYRPMCKNVGSSLQFIRKYGAAIRFYNQGINVVKKVEEKGPIAMQVHVYRKNSEAPIKVNPDEFPDPEALLEQIKKIDTQI